MSEEVKTPSQRRREHLRALERRRKYLLERQDRWNTFEMAEVSALSWCIGIIEAVLDDAPVETTDE